eukprot:12461733-Alexandrium_andersonii.AAC.1
MLVHIRVMHTADCAARHKDQTPPLDRQHCARAPHCLPTRVLRQARAFGRCYGDVLTPGCDEVG